MRYLTNEELMSQDKTISKPINFALGFHASGFYSKALDIDHCYLATQSMNKILNLVRSFSLSIIIFCQFTQQELMKVN